MKIAVAAVMAALALVLVGCDSTSPVHHAAAKPTVAASSASAAAPNCRTQFGNWNPPTGLIARDLAKFQADNQALISTGYSQSAVATATAVDATLISDVSAALAADQAQTGAQLAGSGDYVGAASHVEDGNREFAAGNAATQQASAAIKAFTSGQ